MSPTEFAMYPYTVRMAVTHLTNKIIKARLFQTYKQSEPTYEDPCKECIVLTQGDVQVRSRKTLTEAYLYILANGKLVSKFGFWEYQNCILAFIAVVERLEEQRKCPTPE